MISTRNHMIAGHNYYKFSTTPCNKIQTSTKTNLGTSENDPEELCCV